MGMTAHKQKKAARRRKALQRERNDRHHSQRAIGRAAAKQEKQGIWGLLQGIDGTVRGALQGRRDTRRKGR